MRYRPHIDGLRTVAIIPVLLFHLGITAIPGGFVGVDVFFVISGYLITSVLMNDLGSGRYSIARFYQRRILRIFPALFVMLAIVWVISTFIYFPGELRSVGWQVFSSAAFVSNFYFWSKAGYFTAAAETQPLLHTWSLAVEEQFYIVFPVLLYVLYRFARKRLVPVLIAIGIASLAACIVLTYVHQPTAFYLLPTRAWELGAGALLSVLGARGFGRRAGGWISLVGVALIVVPMLTYTSSTPPFPGWAAILPVAGSVLLIGWAEGTVVGKALSWRPVVYIGTISFSLYLWHWPLIVFYKTLNGPTLDGWEMAGLGLASIACAIVSTEIVERPFRTRRVRAASSRRVIAMGAVCLVIVAGLGGFQIQRPTSALAASPQALEVAGVAEYRTTSDYEDQFRTGTCLIGENDGGIDAFDEATCASIDPNRLNVLLIGDSHAAMFWGGLQETYPNANVMQATASGCRPLLNSPGSPRCTDVRDWAYEDLLATGEVDVVILGGRWEADEMSYVTPTLEYVRGLVDRLVVLGPTVEYDGIFPTLLARSAVNGSDFDVKHNRTPGRDEVDVAMRAATESAGATYVSVLDAICATPDSCTEYAEDGYPMQFDYGHLTLSGSRYVIDAERRVFDQAFAPL